MKNSRIYGLIALCTAGTASIASASAGVTVQAPFDYAETASAIALVAGTVLALTFGWTIGFRLIKKVMGRLAGQA